LGGGPRGGGPVGGTGGVPLYTHYMYLWGYPYIPLIYGYGVCLYRGRGVRGGVLIYTYYICVCAYAYIHTIYVLCVYAYIHTIYVYVQRLIYTMSMLYQ